MLIAYTVTGHRRPFLLEVVAAHVKPSARAVELTVKTVAPINDAVLRLMFRTSGFYFSSTCRYSGLKLHTASFGLAQGGLYRMHSVYAVIGERS